VKVFLKEYLWQSGKKRQPGLPKYRQQVWSESQAKSVMKRRNNGALLKRCQSQKRSKVPGRHRIRIW
jgi:hypothetical protein